MTRTARLASRSDIYHVISRGAGKRDLFEDDEDREFYLNALERFARKEELSILAWCLMDNHIHILCRGELSNMTSMMKRLNTSYAQHFNGRHGHVGPVFQGRFASYPVETEEHFLQTVRYIHLNPRDFGASDPYEYAWSSYKQYIGKGGICRIDFVLSVFGGIVSFLSFHNIGKDDVAMIDGYATRPRITDAEARRIASQIYGEAFSDEIVEMNKNERNQALRLLFDRGISIRQLGRLTGIGSSAIYRAIRGRGQA